MPDAATPHWFVYILRCGDDTFYTGIARDVRARLALHACGRGARYTRSRGPLTLCKTRRCSSKGDALRLEYAIKQLTRSAKEQLILGQRLGRFARQVLDRM
jgi:putative endonuclease